MYCPKGYVFFLVVGLKTGRDFDNYGLKSYRVFNETTKTV